ncbi:MULTISPECIES: hypothetical protein [Acidobacteriaceae]|uniref:hypothetical protein n=1 Tax=Acidobacteriaceae TaxID=204434 RepID=UPI00131E9827|nr:MULTISPECIES: hypothetical protein [Acidobacteriaceae]MDW5267890.1 hypothetical protein [Edaphobacter sp.]
MSVAPSLGKAAILKHLAICLAFTTMAAAQAAPSTAAPIRLVGIRATLNKTLDTQRVKEGDPVSARPEAKLHLADGVDLETSSKLLGHVDTVQPSTDKSDSAITVTFDKVLFKDGRQISVKATILWIGQPPSLLNPTEVSAPADRTTPGVGVGAGMSGTPPSQGYQGSEIAGLPKHHRDTPAAVPPPTGVFSQPNAIPGVSFASDIRKPESGSFTAAGHNVHIPGGTVFAFALAPSP